MVSVLVKPLEERVQQLNQARDAMGPLLAGASAHRHFQNDCETVFSQFRLRVMHLRKEPDALSAVGQKGVVTRFVGRVCTERPFLHDRCEEVLRILMLSDEWMRAFAREAELNMDHLPPGVKDEFKKRLEEVKAGDPNAANDPGRKQPHPQKDAPRDPWSSTPAERKEKLASVPVAGKPSFPGHGVAGAMRVVVQRCSRARLMVDEFVGSWAEIDAGLFVAVSFASKADNERIQYAARFLLTAKLSTSQQLHPGGGRSPSANDADSVANLCNKGEAQGILLMPQSFLNSEFDEKHDDSNPFMYPQRAERDNAKKMYDLLVEALTKTAREVASGPNAQEPRIVAGGFSGRQFLEMTSAGPFMHSFII